jgi:hypothetical protein
VGEIDQQKEKQRLEKLFAGMEDEELEKVSGDWLKLTGPAKAALRAEMAKRGMNLEEIDRLEREGPWRPDPPPVVIRRYRDLPDAWIAQSVIDSAGIDSVLLDENIVGLNWFYSNAMGGVKLQVRARDAEDADALLSLGWVKEFDVPGFGTYRQPVCPNCGSMDVSHGGLDRPLTYLLLLVNLPIPIPVEGWQCYSCRSHWQGQAEANPV